MDLNWIETQVGPDMSAPGRPPSSQAGLNWSETQVGADMGRHVLAVA